jgi:bifunctional non-homologous end joining protein LigD
MGVLELHVWGSTNELLEKPDRLVFDLDPAPHVPLKKLKIGAHRLRDRLKELGLTSFLKTTGGKGLHIVAPIVPELSWDPIKRLTKTISESLMQDYPGDYVIKSGKALREGKIFIDYLRNGRGATSVCPYSTRAKAGATVSTPLAWEELENLNNLDQFTMESIPPRLKNQKSHPWKGFFALQQKIPNTLKKGLR